MIGLGCSSGDSDTLSAGELALQNAGSHLDGDGLCAAVAQINSACPPELAWDNHGQYVSCVAHYLSARVDAGDLDEEQKGELVSLAAQSSIGKKHGQGQPPAFGGCDGVDAGAGGAPGYPGDDHDDDDHDDDDDDHDGGADDGDGHGGAGDRDDDDGHGGFDGDDGRADGGCPGSDDKNEAGADWGWGGRP